MTTQAARKQTNTITAGLLLQFVNPKVILYSITTLIDFYCTLLQFNSRGYSLRRLPGFCRFRIDVLLVAVWVRFPKVSAQSSKADQFGYGAAIGLLRCIAIFVVVKLFIEEKVRVVRVWKNDHRQKNHQGAQSCSLFLANGMVQFAAILKFKVARGLRLIQHLFNFEPDSAFRNLPVDLVAFMIAQHGGSNGGHD
jgi:hypothetical protein